ncbi:MAG TPA: hypothetical protein VFL83_21440 [Anaeromyxobacter sp.]|nr:hypothetical protein [Anaeromyxobacter sp.]
MRSAYWARAGIAGLAALLPFAAAALTMSGHVGGVYQKSEAAQDGYPTRSIPSLDFDGRLNLAGFAVQPGLVDWSGGIGYRRLRVSQDSVTSTTKWISYDASVLVLRRGNSPFSLSASAARATTDFSTSVAPDLVGTRLTNSYAARANVAAPGRPFLELRGALQQTEDSGVGPRSTRDIRTLGATAKHSTSAFAAKLNYDGEFGTGTYSAFEYDSHAVSAMASSHLGPGSELYLEEHYFLRTPKATGSGAYRFEANRFRVGAKSARESSDDQLSYAHSHGYVGSTEAESRDVVQQGVSYYGRRRLSPRWEILGTASAGVAQTRHGTAEVRAWNQAFAPLARWTSDTSRAVTFRLGMGPSFGLTETDAGTSVMYGGNGDAWVGWRSGESDATGAYNIAYGADPDAGGGWSLRQIVQGTAGTTGAGIRWQANASVHSERAHSPLLGDAATRRAEVRGSARWRRHELALNASISEGVSNPLSATGSGDGLFLPLGFDTTSRAVGAQAFVGIARNLTFSAHARYGTFSGPGRPDTSERGGGAAIEYALAGFRFSFDDRYVVSDLGPYSRRENILMLRAIRAFGARF